MDCSNCIYHRRVKWSSKDIRLAGLKMKIRWMVTYSDKKEYVILDGNKV